MSIKNDLQTIKFYLNDDLKKQWKDDKIKVNFEFSCLVDSLQKDNEISQKTSENVYLYENKKHEIILTCCSYSVKVA